MPFSSSSYSYGHSGLDVPEGVVLVGVGRVQVILEILEGALFPVFLLPVVFRLLLHRVVGEVDHTVLQVLGLERLAGGPDVASLYQ